MEELCRSFQFSGNLKEIAYRWLNHQCGKSHCHIATHQVAEGEWKEGNCLFFSFYFFLLMPMKLLIKQVSKLQPEASQPELQSSVPGLALVSQL